MTLISLLIGQMICSMNKILSMIKKKSKECLSYLKSGSYIDLGVETNDKDSNF